MKIFGSLISPYVRKVHVVAAEKGIAVESAPANPRDPSPEFAAASPFRKIPAMMDGDFGLPDSTAIVSYMDALQPSPALISGDAKQRARAVWFEEFADTILFGAGIKVVFNRFVAPMLGMQGNVELAEQGEAELVPILEYLESVAPAEGWLAGADCSIGDISVACMLKSLNYVRLTPDPDTHPRSAAWFARVAARPAWQAVAETEAKSLQR